MENLNEFVNSPEKNKFEKLLEKIPGIKGYKEKEARRDTDKLVREAIAKRFEEQWNRIGEIQRDLLKAGNLLFVGDLESAAIKIRQFIDRVKTASYGYAGLLDVVKVDDAALQQLYDYDLYLFKLAESIKSAVDVVESNIEKNEEIETAIRNLVSVAQECITAFNRRSEVITGTVNS
ncbi:hypothetical protein [Flexilinea flocculi]|uniref:Uncharacterized protein n=1 Tax=Flexilinea flocculi TaxID=1678840 RepID=A0A0K8PB88_9CHLR|nr:hypothetical protein [Flexilinea flocculi]GAP39927.1 hypothetical protein ATC1_12465 [Flexilinea flocculi]